MLAYMLGLPLNEDGARGTGQPPLQCSNAKCHVRTRIMFTFRPVRAKCDRRIWIMQSLLQDYQ
jgi:hypothetical protein